MDSRCAQILINLMDSGSPITINDMSKMLKVSMRTIRYDLNEIDQFLLECHLPQLIRKQHSGIQLVLNSQEQIVLNQTLLGIGNYQYILSPEERKKFILLELIEHNRYMTIQELADKLYVCRSTVILDVRSLRNRLKPFQVQILSRTKKGIKLYGDEKKIRSVLFHVLLENVDNGTIIEKIKTSSLSNSEVMLDQEIMNLFADVDIGFIEKCIQIAEEELATLFSDTAYSGIVVHIAMAIKRIQLGKDIIMSREELDSLTYTKEFSVASHVGKMLEDHFQIQVPIDEIGYITVHMLGANSFKNHRGTESQEYQILVQTLIGTMSKLAGVNLYDDQILYQGLTAHIKPVIYRLQNKLSLKNPLLTEIKTLYSATFCKTKETVAPIEAFAGTSMDEDEIGYFTMHFAAALERKKSSLQDQKTPDVLLVCSTGMGSAQILKTRIQMLFRVNIIDSISAHHVEGFLSSHSVNLVISTICLPDLKAPVVIVNPMLNEHDIKLLGAYLDRPMPISSINFQNILKIIEENCEIKNRKALENQLKQLFDTTKIERDDGPLLRELLTRQMINVQVDAKDWEDAVHQCGALLVQAGSAKPSYVEAMIESVKNIGPYIVIAPGIAMPHARPETGANRTGFSLITLKKPVCFGNKENDPVKIVVCLCSSDSKLHIKALSELVNLLADDENVRTINQAASVDTVLQLLQKKAS